MVITDARKRFGAVQALAGVDFKVDPGEIVGLVGHNGAGKSTLVQIIAGTLQRDGGDFSIGGEAIAGPHDPHRAHNLGVRCVFQELSLCANLDIVENTRVLHRPLQGMGWRKRARKLIADNLDAIFPGHGISLRSKVGNLPISARQMVEVARAYSTTDTEPRLVILDEPTSALGHRAADQLLSFVRRAGESGVAAILISHRLDEIIKVCGRIVVMVDGRVVADRPTEGLSRKDVVALMGSIEAPPSGAATARKAAGLGAPLIEAKARDPRDVPIELRAGEIIGFAGLDGHGQRERLREIYARTLGVRGLAGPPAAYVAGDRQTEGVFPLWAIRQNLSIRSISTLSRKGFITRDREDELATAWVDKMGVRTTGIEQPILSLSGGNQQKVLFARALASDAVVVFLDDPMRGVDVGTKQEVYRLIHAEAAAGRCFVWYTTELEELTNCHSVYVFREGLAVVRLAGADVTPTRILESSFTGAPDV
jgi:ribose transport system ATP-binding protein